MKKYNVIQAHLVTLYSWKSKVEDIACLSYHVKNIKFCDYDSQTAFGLVKFLFQNSKVLKNTEIICASGQIEVKDIAKIIAPPRASSEVVVCFSVHGARQPDFSWFV
ncbi:hypothetical protein ACJIZ3_011264 [Penstemon smallii]|uniref:FBD domain-containing protein n=1 Tax=Penstemon smallii TaxID=265156 RepID=A0ABD3UM79_9LAMI